MRSRKKRLIAAALTAVMTVSLLGHQVSAMQYMGTDSYMSGKYYRGLKQVKLTGDPRTDIVAIAKSQVGYQEGSSQNELSGEVYGDVNFTEWGAWYGMQDMWCAMFVSWCANLAGISTDTVPSHSYTPEGLNWFAERGLAYTRAEVQARKYTPKPGDIIYFKSSRNAKPTNHVGIVTDYSNGRVYTVEGNVGAIGKTTGGGMVAFNSYPISNTYIAFICAPNYENGSTAVLPDADSREAALRLENLREALFAVETGEGISYGAVNTDRMGGVSVGCGQWYGARAIQLLTEIYQADPSAYTALDPDKRLMKSLNPLTKTELVALQQILESESGILVQNAWMDESLQVWMDRAAALGITDPDALLLCVALYQLRGEASAQRLITEGADKNTLLNVIKDREPDLYRTCCLLVE